VADNGIALQALLDKAGVRGCPYCGKTIEPRPDEIGLANRGSKAAISWTCEDEKTGFHWKKTEPISRYA
jgi:hypothetical protein